VNRTEAYKLLVNELEKIRVKGIVAANATIAESNEYIVSNDAGKAYSINLRISDNVLYGSITELNSFKFELLEESVDID